MWKEFLYKTAVIGSETTSDKNSDEIGTEVEGKRSRRTKGR